jgi:hypothetical protein
MALSMVVGRDQARVMLPALRVPSGGLVWSGFSSYSIFKFLDIFICHESEARKTPLLMYYTAVRPFDRSHGLTVHNGETGRRITAVPVLTPCRGAPVPDPDGGEP